MDVARTLVSADSYRDRRTVMKQIAEDVLAGRCEDGAYFVSKAWYGCKAFTFFLLQISADSCLFTVMTEHILQIFFLFFIFRRMGQIVQYTKNFYSDINARCRLQQWLKRKILDAPTEADAGPTVSIRCPHGKLMPEQAVGAKRLLVPENLWLFLYGDATTVKPDDSMDCSTFPLDSRRCSQCSDELSEVACIEDSLRSFLYFSLMQNDTCI